MESWGGGGGAYARTWLDCKEIQEKNCMYIRWIDFAVTFLTKDSADEPNWQQRK